MKHLKGNISEELVNKYGDALNRFLDRTWSSNSVNDSEKLHRLDIATNAMSVARHFAGLCVYSDKKVLNVATARILSSVRERDDRWITHSARVFGLPEQDLRENIALGDDSVLLAILIHVTHRYIPSMFPNRNDLEVLPKFDICNTLPRLQHDFCTLWNEMVQHARRESYTNGPYGTPADILYWIRHHYIALHQVTGAFPTTFLSYPLCDLASHRPDSIPQIYVPFSFEHHISFFPQPRIHRAFPPSQIDGDNTASRQAKQVKNIVEPPSTSNPTTTSEIGATSHSPDTTRLANTVHSSSRLTGASSTAFVDAAPQDITSTAPSSHPLDGSEHQGSDIVAPSAEPGTSQVKSTASTHEPTPTLVPIPTSLPKSYKACVSSVSNSSHFPPPSIGSFIPASRQTSCATLPRLRARGLVNTGNICFVNAVFQLLLRVPSFWNLFRELGDQMGQRGPGVPETGGGATPLVDATMRFFKEFIVQESSSSMQEQLQPAFGGTSTTEEEKKHDNLADSFEPTYMYDAIKEKRQLKPLLVRSHAHVAASS